MNTVSASGQPAMYGDALSRLRCKGLDPDSVTEHLRASIGLEPGDILVLCGSLAEGLGNQYSDVDLLLVTDRTDIPYTSLQDVVLFINDNIVDIHVEPVTGVTRLIACLSEWASEPREAREATAIGPDERKLLHRIKRGVPLYGSAEFETQQRAIDEKALSRHLIELSSYLVSTIQVDLAGFHRSRDATSLHFAGQHLLGHVMDALLASQGMTNTNPKWRVRQLSSLPSEWEDGFYGRKTGATARDLYLSLSRFSEQDGPKTLVDRSLNIAALARRVLPVLTSDLKISAGHRLSSADDVPAASRLPQLDLDVTVKFRNGRYELFRLNTKYCVFSLTVREYSMLCLFDGTTTFSYACRYAEALWGERNADELVEQLIALINYGNFAAPAYVDDTALAQLLVM